MAKIHQNKTNQKKPVTQQRLMNAASYYCARFEATQARLTRVLERKVRRWLQSHDISEVQPLIAQTVERCVALGLVDDARYASLRTDQLLRKGQSAQRIAQDLRHKGLESAVAAQISGQISQTQLRQAAAALARRRRLGPYRGPREAAAFAADERRMLDKEVAVFARAGHAYQTAAHILALPDADAVDAWVNEAVDD